MEQRIQEAVEHAVAELWGAAMETLDEIPKSDEATRNLAETFLRLITASVRTLGQDSGAAEAFLALNQDERSVYVIKAMEKFYRRRMDRLSADTPDEHVN